MFTNCLKKFYYSKYVCNILEYVTYEDKRSNASVIVNVNLAFLELVQPLQKKRTNLQ